MTTIAIRTRNAWSGRRTTAWQRSSFVAAGRQQPLFVTTKPVMDQIWRGLRPIVHMASPPCDPDTLLQMNLQSTLGRVTTGLRDWWRREDVPVSLRVEPPDEAKPPVPAAYLPLYAYLDRRYAATVVLTFEQIEALLGFAPPSPAFADAEWWTRSEGATDRHGAAWTAARRTAAPHLSARIVAFERLG